MCVCLYIYIQSYKVPACNPCSNTCAAFSYPTKDHFRGVVARTTGILVHGLAMELGNRRSRYGIGLEEIRVQGLRFRGLGIRASGN